MLEEQTQLNETAAPTIFSVLINLSRGPTSAGPPLAATPLTTAFRAALALVVVVAVLGAVIRSRVVVRVVAVLGPVSAVG